MNLDTSTIAAIATAQAAGGIGIVRLSGPDALAIAAAVFRPVRDVNLLQSPGYRAYYGTVIEQNTSIDEAICLVFRAPHSYTGEDVVEFSCHGGLYNTQRVLRTLLSAGAQPASAGEFTKRAFLNGRIDLTQAESVMSLIGAQSETAAQAAYTALEGALAQQMDAILQVLLHDCAQLAAWVDYPDEEIAALQPETLLAHFRQIDTKLSDLLAGFDQGRAATDGVDTVIVGRPNVGKSTLMNLLSGQERSIVTDIPGTTRDIVEETVRLGNVILHIADTAGIRQTENPVEQIGVDWAKKRMERAQLVLAVFDQSDMLTAEDHVVLRACANKLTIALVNKTDLPPQLDLRELQTHCRAVVPISARSGSGYDALCQTVAQLLGTDQFDPGAARLANERQRQCCRDARACVREGIAALQQGMTLDAVNVCAEGAIGFLSALTGRRVSDQVVDTVFSDFCVGK